MTQFSTQSDSFLNTNRNIYDVVYLANNANGDIISVNNPLPVSLGSESITITGSVTIPATINVASSPADPVHAHITEVGTSGILTVPYMPIDGNVNVNNIITVTGNVTATGTVNIGNLPSVQTVNGTINIANTVQANVTNWPTTQNVNVNGTVTTLPDPSIGTFYGEPYAIPITPIVQLTGVYGVDPLDTQTYTNSGGTVSSSLSCYDISVSSNVGSYAVLRSRRFNTFRAGESLLARGYLKFDDPTPLFSQRWGIQNQENGFYLGYNGNTFGILQTKGGKVPLYKVTVTSYTGTQTVTLTLNGVPYTISIVTGESINLAAHRISDANFNGTWLTTQRGNTVELLYTGVLAPLGGTFSITSTGNLVAAVTTMQVGVAATDTWVYTTDVNGPVLPANIDPTVFQQYQIKYNCAGVSFFVLSPTTIPRYVLIYTHLNIAGSVTQPEISNPAFKVAGLALSLGSTTVKSLFINNMSLAVEGIVPRIKYSRGSATTQITLVKDTLHHILSVQNSLTYNNTINCIELLLQDISGAIESGDPAEIYLYLDAPLLTGRHDFQNVLGFVAGVSKVEGTIDVNTNEPIAVLISGKNGVSFQFDLTNYRAVVPAGSYISIAVKSTAAISRASIATVWYAE